MSSCFFGVVGNELRWRFTSDGSVNGWGFRFLVYPIISPGTMSYFISLNFHQFAFNQILPNYSINCYLIYNSIIGVAACGELQSERLLLARPSISAVACVLDSLFKYLQSDFCAARSTLITRLAIALAGCAQRSVLSNILTKVLQIILITNACLTFIFSIKTSNVGFAKSAEITFQFISCRVVFIFFNPGTFGRHFPFTFSFSQFTTIKLYGLFLPILLFILAYLSYEGAKDRYS